MGFQYVNSQLASPNDLTFDEDDDSLGFYSDGVKRTLTDDQIAMFRHSELHALELEKSRADNTDSDAREASAQSQAVETFSTHKSLPEEPTSGDEDEEEYAKFLEQERQQFQAAAAQKARPREHSPEPHDRTISTRRKVRELDQAPVTSEAFLDY